MRRRHAGSCKPATERSKSARPRPDLPRKSTTAWWRRTRKGRKRSRQDIRRESSEKKVDVRKAAKVGSRRPRRGYVDLERRAHRRGRTQAPDRCCRASPYPYTGPSRHVGDRSRTATPTARSPSTWRASGSTKFRVATVGAPALPSPVVPARCHVRVILQASSPAEGARAPVRDGLPRGGRSARVRPARKVPKPNGKSPRNSKSRRGKPNTRRKGTAEVREQVRHASSAPRGASRVSARRDIADARALSRVRRSSRPGPRAQRHRAAARRAKKGETRRRGAGGA